MTLYAVVLRPSTSHSGFRPDLEWGKQTHNKILGKRRYKYNYNYKYSYMCKYKHKHTYKTDSRKR